MAKTSITMMTSTAGVLNKVGPAIKGPSFYGMSRNIITVAISANNFVGRVYIQGSLATSPTEHDWFPIWLEAGHPYIECPFDRHCPTGNETGDSGVFSFTFQANLVWIRALVDRSYLQMPQVLNVGTIQSVLLNF